MMKMGPIEEKQRIESLDILRGLAVFGILLVNMKSFSGPDSPIRSLSYEFFDHPIDVWTNVMLEFFVQGNFITMFSFLFGFGIILMAKKAAENKRSFVAFFLRRQVVLLLFGILHVLFFWHGDILITYSVVGTVMLLFYRMPPKMLIALAMVLLITYSLFTTILTYQYWSSGAALSYQETQDRNSEAEIADSIKIYSSGSYSEIMRERYREWSELNAYFVFFIWSLLPMFLIGAYAAKERTFKTVTLWKIWWATLALGAGSKILPVIAFPFKGEDWRYDTSMAWGYEFGGAMMSLFYICSVILLVRAGKLQRVFSMLKTTGRMAFTNYLAQSIIGTTIFYSYGLGIYGKFGPFVGLLFSLAIFSLQVVFSSWWLKRNDLGPLEWVWRSLTYGSVLRIKRQKQSG
jgi:uncharacterized protein